jgi:glycosyltransferase involved in cell wall biosynthesis
MHVLISKAKCFDILVTLNQSDSDDWAKYVKTKIISNIAHLNSTGLFSELKSNRVIFAGRYTYQKGIPDLFKIWEIVYERHPDWHLDLYGDGNIQEISCSEDERLQKNIHVHQPDSNIFERYLESSVFVLTSLYEPFGLVMPEAMSCGLPVVAFDCPSGPANIITDGLDGYLIKNRDIDEFAEKLCQLIESPQLRHEMGKAAIQSSQRYSTEQVMPQWIRLFQELIMPS